MKGLVLESHGHRVLARILNEEGSVIQATLRGKIRLQKLKSTNPVCCGDFVELCYNQGTGDWTVESVEDRRNHMVRKATNLSKQTHALAANLDRVWIVCSLFEPRFSGGFADRIALTAAAFGIPCHLVLNKSDRWTADDSALAQHWQEVYAEAGIQVWFCSALNGDGIPELAEAMNQGTQLLTGYSGAGKSSLINALFPGLQAATGAISSHSGKGTHTTTAATLYETGPGTAVIDSPGIKEWGILDLQPYEIAYHFREIRAYAPGCRFPNCSHSHEPSCAVQEAVKEGRIHSERFVSYLSILANDDQYN